MGTLSGIDGLSGPISESRRRTLEDLLCESQELGVDVDVAKDVCQRLLFHRMSSNLDYLSDNPTIEELYKCTPSLSLRRMFLACYIALRREKMMLSSQE